MKQLIHDIEIEFGLKENANKYQDDLASGTYRERYWVIYIYKLVHDINNKLHHIK